MFRGGRQLPWALLLDGLARELDIVIVVSAGNVANPEVPQVCDSADFQREVFRNLSGPEHALIDPACAANVLTVGSIARADVVSTRFTGRNPGDRVTLVGSPQQCPSPFTRIGFYGNRGHGLHRSVKPELVGYGGNYCLDQATRTRWQKNEPNLGEPSLAYDFNQTGRLLSVSCGTSCSAPYVTHVAAQVENALKLGPYQGRMFSANLVRALVVHSAELDGATADWCSEGNAETDAEGILLKTVGYGRPTVERAAFSDDNRVVLISEDEVQENHIHLYELEIPASFVQTRGRRWVRVTLAYDPPVRGTRSDYLGRTMWFQMYRGLTSDAVIAAAANSTDGNPPPIPKRNKVKSRPPFQSLVWSTVQSASFEGRQNRAFAYSPAAGAPYTFHILVGCTKRFETELSDMQRYSLVVSLEHSDDQVRIYQEIQQRVAQRARVRQTV